MTAGLYIFLHIGHDPLNVFIIYLIIVKTSWNIIFINKKSIIKDIKDPYSQPVPELV